MFYNIDIYTLIIFFSFEVSIFLSIKLEKILLQNNPLATFRRLGVFASFSNSIWFFVIFLGTILSIPFSISVQKYFLILILGFFYILSFRALIISSVFFGNFFRKIFITIFQPLLIIFFFTFPLFSKFGFSITLFYPILGGITVLVSILTLLIFINRIGTNYFSVGSLYLFRAFLLAWAANKPDILERFIETMSTQRNIGTNAIVLNSMNRKTILVIPEVHPGPFNPVGSSNLPLFLRNWFLEKGFFPFIVHGVSGHETNLPSKEEVKNYLKTFENFEVVALGKTCSRPIITKIGRATVTCIAFGKSVLVMPTLSPYGMEDLPFDLKQKIEEISLKFGFKHVILVDTHNSQGESIKEKEFEDITRAFEESLNGLTLDDQQPIKVGSSHSSELNLLLQNDIGPAGLGVLIFSINDKKHTIIISDSNSAVLGLREELINRFENSDTPILELCTSDTHISAGKISSLKGYLALGEKTDINELTRNVSLLIKKAISQLNISDFKIKYVNSSVKVIGSNLINYLSLVIDKSLSLFKKGISVILFLSVIILFLNTFFG